MSFILIGMPGSGKTTVIRTYEKIYGKHVCDTDEFIENRHGEINKIFADHGEEYFRRIETKAIREICGGNATFIATGGGAVLREENVRIFKASGRIVFLRADKETLLKRLEGDTSRPLLMGDKKSRLSKLYDERTPIYVSVADIIIDTDDLTAEEVLNKILNEN